MQGPGELALVFQCVTYAIWGSSVDRKAAKKLLPVHTLGDGEGQPRVAVSL